MKMEKRLLSLLLSFALLLVLIPSTIVDTVMATPVTAPVEPSWDEIKTLLGDKAIVQIECVNNSAHNENCAFNEEYWSKNVVQDSSSGQYVCILSIFGDKYVELAYNSAHEEDWGKHVLCSDSPIEIRLVYEDGAWKYQGDSNPIVFRVLEKPTLDDLPADLIEVRCAEDKHSSKFYGVADIFGVKDLSSLLDTPSDVTYESGIGYISRIAVYGGMKDYVCQRYVDEYPIHDAENATIMDRGGDNEIITIVWNGNTNKWEVANNGRVVYLIDCLSTTPSVTPSVTPSAGTVYYPDYDETPATPTPTPVPTTSAVPSVDVDDSVSPKTGDSSPVLAVLVLLSAAAVFGMSKVCRKTAK